MHKTPLLILCLSLAINLSAQTLCEDFDSFTVPTNNKQHAFNTYGNGNAGFLQNWTVTNGTPAILTNGDLGGTNAYNGTQCALMAVCDVAADWSEGLALNYNFQQGKTYTVTMAVRNAPLSTTPTPIDVNFLLLKSAIAFTYQTQTGCTQTASVPGTAQSVHSVSSFADNSWQTINFTISNLADNYTQLWVRSQFSSGSPSVTTFLLMDAVCIEEVNTAVTCHQFDDTLITDASSRQHAFNLFGNGNGGFLNDWLVASGTPTLFASGSLANINAYSGSQAALMAVCDVAADWNESLELIHSFDPGKTYDVSFALRNAQSLGASAATVDFLLLSAPINFTYQTQTGCTQVPAIPSTALNVHSITNLTANSWSTYSFTISGLSSSYPYLWIRPRFASGSAQTTTFVLLDSLCIAESTPVSVKNIDNNLPVQIYPNPANSLVTVKLSGKQNLQQIKLYNYAGSMVREWQNLQTNLLTIDVSDYSKGIYVIDITDTQGNRTVRKLQVQN